MEEAVTESIIRQANETFGQIEKQSLSPEKENMDYSNSIINVETFVN